MAKQEPRQRRRRLEEGGLDRPGRGPRACCCRSTFRPSPSARRETPIPYEDLQLLSAVFGKIKSDYVEPVPDDKLIKEAINGMVHGLDPHSDFPRRRSVQGAAGLHAGQVRRPRHRGGRRGRHHPRHLADRGHARVPRRHQVGRPHRQDRRHRDARPAAVQGRRQDARQAGHAGGADRRAQGRRDAADLHAHCARRSTSRACARRCSSRATATCACASSRSAPARTSPRRSRTSTRKGELKGLVLDLRSDPGGLLNQAVAVSAAFLPKDALVVYTDGRTPDARMRLTANKDNYSRRGDDYFTRPAGRR